MMKIGISKPLSFCEIGKKDNQEDCIWPPQDKLDESCRCFVLCDGMGGHENGEVASSTISAAIGEYYLTHSQTGDIEAYFKEALAYAYDALDAKDTSDSIKKMGTTLTCVLLHENGYLVAHIGDSRIYHIRPSSVSETSLGILYRTSDHSLVNSLLQAGEITEEEARNFPQKNVITRAIQPHQETRTKADVYCFSDIEAGDYFFMCCDGVLENLTDRRLSDILADNTLDDMAKLAAIKAECDGKTRDNYTCILIPISSVEGKTCQDTCSSTIMASVTIESNDYHLGNVSQSAVGTSTRSNIHIKRPRLLKYVLLAIVAILLVMSGFFILKQKSATNCMDLSIEQTEQNDSGGAMIKKGVGKIKKLFSKESFNGMNEDEMPKDSLMQ